MRALGVTGALLFSSREFLQVLEGAREAVNQTCARLLPNPRHAEVTILDFSEVPRRLFAGWAMHQVATGWLTRARILRYGERELFSPTRMSAANALALLEDLAEQGADAAEPEPGATTGALPATPADGAGGLPGLIERLRGRPPGA